MSHTSTPASHRLAPALSLAALAGYALLAGCSAGLSELVAAEAAPQSCGPLAIAGPNVDPVAAVVFVGGGRANTQVTPPDALMECVPQDIAHPLHVVHVTAAGQGTRVFNATFTPTGRPDDETALKALWNGAHASLAEATGADPETDSLNVVEVGIQSVLADSGRRVLIVDDGLLSTAGRLQYQLEPDYLWTDAEVLWAELADHFTALYDADGDGAVEPVLAGVDVVLTAAVGSHAGTQTALSVEQQARLATLYTYFFERLGAATVVQWSVALVEPDQTALPEVTPVTLPAPPVVTLPATRTCEEVVLNDSVVGFQPDTALFLDEGRARQVVAQVAESLAGCTGRVQLTGTTADIGDRDGQIALSADRALAVRSLLAEALGADPESIACEGVGSDFAGHLPEYNADGTFNPANAQANRAVRITLKA